MVNEDQTKFERGSLERIGELEDQVKALTNLVFVQQEAIKSLQNATVKLSENLDTTLSQVLENRTMLINISKHATRKKTSPIMKGVYKYEKEKRNPWINCRFYIDIFNRRFMAYLDTYSLLEK